MRLKSHQLAVREFSLTKRDYDGVDEDERLQFFMLAQVSNEIGMLHAVLLQALNGLKPHLPKAVRETSLGMALYMARLMTNRIYEGWSVASAQKTVALLNCLWESVPENPANVEIYAQTMEARERLSAYFGVTGNLITKVRNKQASHIDRASFAGAYALAPDDLDMTDFHTGMVGTTFFGGADSLQAIAVAHLAGGLSPNEASDLLFMEVMRVAEDLKTFIDGFSVAFVIGRFGAKKLMNEPRILSDLPSTRRARVHYFMT
ncbi:hypothetical protein [Brevundimonas naejangsanensis]|uniref:hypothetical protein n=1 Tax=Brevundimonas naejangsanensis TaxID=588932 RepID=UPI000EEB2E2A|nr:hypothetical protein [Brevundimonas naejangsanensis]HAC01946.1 hypothetical protein [Brevundimonas sp.]